ncbi:MAG TPA: DUF92 domain-containing protein [Gemmatimonadaceae bacterium]
MTPLLLRALVGSAAAAVAAILSRRVGSLSANGAFTALILGAAASAAGWSWAVLLVAYFAASSALSHWKRAAKEARTGAVVAKGGARDAWQVLANGGVFGGAALASIVLPYPAWLAVAAGALAASSADTWGTEIGTAAGGTPRSLLGGRAVPPGTSGAISVAGSLATLAGAAFIALLASALGWVDVMLPALVGGTVGAFVDSLLGATIQQRRWCDTCQAATERSVHGCGSITRVAGGLAWMDNDVVNLLCTLAGAGVAWWV